MIYSRSSEYAIRAFMHLAQAPDGKYVMVKQIAEQENIPAHFLAKILQQLARKGLLRSSKGPTGGFALRKPASEIALVHIVEALDGLADADRLSVACGAEMRDTTKTPATTTNPAAATAGMSHAEPRRFAARRGAGASTTASEASFRRRLCRKAAS